MNPIKVNPDAIHMNASMRVPRYALMFRSASALMKTLLKMENMTVATTDATIVHKAVTKVKRTIGRERKRMKVGR